MDKYSGKYSVDEITIVSSHKMIVSGWVLSNEEYQLRAIIDNSREIVIDKKTVARLDVTEIFNVTELMCGFKQELEIEKLDFKEIKLQICQQGKWLTLEIKSREQIIEVSDFIKYHIDQVLLEKDMVRIQGWAFSKVGNIPHIIVKGNRKFEIEIKERQDVQNAYSEILNHNKIGFEIIVKTLLCNKITIQYSAENYIIQNEIIVGRLKQQRMKERLKKVVKLTKLASIDKIKKAIVYLSKNGFKALFVKLNSVLSENKDYINWITSQMPTEEELQEQRDYKFGYEPLISIIVPTYNTPKRFLIEMIESVIKQTYSNWELCIADGNSQTPETIELLKEYAVKDKRIKVKFLNENLGISGNSNACLELAVGEFIGLFDHDDLLAPHALYEVVKILNEDRSLDFIYSDEDKTDEETKTFFDPHFKPDWSPDTLRSYNYICHFTVFRSNLLKKVGKFNKEYDGSQDYDLFLRLTESSNRIYHIPKILYHWRVHMQSTAANLGAKGYTVDAARRALQAHIDRIGLEGQIEHGLILGTHRANYKIQGEPKVSIIIPTKDHIDDLSKCIESIQKSTYYNYEVIIVENNSEQQSTFDYYEILKKQEKISVVVWEKEFNYSAINNFGVQFAKGEYLVLLNNDIEIITPNWIEEMLMHCQREEVGIVGAKLYYPDDTIQHAGVIIGIGGVAGHSHKYFAREDNGYFSRLKIIQNLSAVTAACLMVRRDVFDSVDGLDEAFKVAFNDVDFCLRVGQKEKLTIFTPYVEAYHHESKSRGAEDTPEKAKRFEGEVNRFYSRWGSYRRDSYYNDNLTLEREDFGLQINKN